MLEWLAMGKYAAFVWGAYAIALGGLSALTILTWRAERKAKALAERGASAP